MVPDTDDVAVKRFFFSKKRKPLLFFAIWPPRRLQSSLQIRREMETMLTMLLHKIKLKYMLRNKKKSKHRKLTQNFVPRYHKAHLTRRLILDTSADSEMEENMVEWLRVSTVYTSQHQVSFSLFIISPCFRNTDIVYM